MARWPKGERAVEFLIGRGRLEAVKVGDPPSQAEALLRRARLRAEATAAKGLEAGDVDGSYAAAYDAYRIAAEALLARQGLRATVAEGSHVAVEDAVSAQFAEDIPDFAKATFERLRRTRHAAQYFDPSAAPITRHDAEWAIGKALGAIAGTQALLSSGALDLFG